MYRLLVKNKSDVYEDLLIGNDGGLILEANDPLNYEFGKANKTFSIFVPNTAKNNYLLDNLFTKGFDGTVKFTDVYLGIENNLLLKGILRVQEIGTKDARLQFISSNFDLIEDLKNKSLQDFAYLTQHVVSAANQVSSETLALNSGNVVYDLIDRGKTQYHANSPESNPDLYKNRVTVGERYPAYRVKKIMDILFAGYTIGGNHFTNTLFSEQQYLLFSRANTNISGDITDWDRNQHNLELKYSEDSSVFYDLSAASSYDHKIYAVETLDTVVSDIKSMWPIQLYITIKVAGVYNLEFRCGGVIEFLEMPAVTSPKFVVEITKGSTPVVIKKDELTYKVVEESDQEFDIYATTGNCYFAANDIIRCNIYMQGTIPTPENQVGFNVIQKANKCYAKATINTAIGEGMTLDMETALPNIKAADFIKWYLQEFNLQLFISIETKQVIFFKQQGATVNEIDITTLIIADSIRSSPDSIRDNYIFQRKIADAKIQALDKYSDINHAYLMDNGSENTQVFESEFSTTHQNPIPKFGMTEDSPQIWQGYSLIKPNKEPDWATDAGLRLVYDAGSKTCSIKHEQAGTTVAPTRTTYLKLSPVVTGFDSHFDGDLFADYHSENMNNKIFGHIIELDLVINDDFIRALYYLESDKDWRNIFAIKLTGFTGRYKFIQLKRKKDNVYYAKMYKLL